MVSDDLLSFLTLKVYMEANDPGEWLIWTLGFVSGTSRQTLI